MNITPAVKQVIVKSPYILDSWTDTTSAQKSILPKTIVSSLIQFTSFLIYLV